MPERALGPSYLNRRGASIVLLAAERPQASIVDLVMLAGGLSATPRRIARPNAGGSHSCSAWPGELGGGSHSFSAWPGELETRFRFSGHGHPGSAPSSAHRDAERRGEAGLLDRPERRAIRLFGRDP